MLAVLAAALACACSGAAADHPTVVVSAAASLADVMAAVGSLYESAHGERIVLNTGASNTLARQIAAGARVDVFISADQAQMDAVAGAVVDGTRVDLLANRLAIAVAADRGRDVWNVRDLLDPSIARVAVGDPAAVPAGVYAREYFERLGMWASLQPKLVPTGSVRLALAAVENGGADAAVVYATDVAAARRARAALVVPAAEGPRIRYPAAVIGTGDNRDGGRRLLAFLRSAAAAAVFTRAGFTVVG
jgi:molybdate transport system substrate-binding protein